MKKILSIISALVLLAALLSGCESSNPGSTLPPSPSDSGGEKTTLTLALLTSGGYVDSNLQSAVAEFNRTNPDYKIKFNLYNSVGTDGITKLNTEIIAGNVPDIFEVSEFPFARFAAKGLFEDLNPYLDAAPELSLVPSVRRALQTDGKLFRITPRFSVMTLIGSSDYLGTDMGWTFEEMKAALANAPEGATVFNSSFTRDTILTYLLYQNMEPYVDWESGETYFDSPDFKALLEFVKSCPANEQPYYRDETQINAGLQLVTHAGYASLSGFKYTDNYLNGKTVVKGFPNADKNVGVLYPSFFTLSMSAVSEHKDAIWQFIRIAMLRDFSGNLSAIQSKFDEQVAEDMTVPDGNGAPATQEQYEKFMALIDASDTTIMGIDTVLQEIIAEETAPYFAGQKPLDDVCKIIQSRAQIYVNEQK
jgi:ABC-type glycerol-3-phosphate transport system substrate-binding protein